jgi:hypothetical protein
MFSKPEKKLHFSMKLNSMKKIGRIFEGDHGTLVENHCHKKMSSWNDDLLELLLHDC